MGALNKTYFEYFVEGLSSDELEFNILRACYLGNMEDLRSAIAESPKSINSRESKSGATALHIACSLGNFSMVKYLLSVDGIDLKAKDFDGRDAYDHAWACGNRRVLELIDKKLYPWKYTQEFFEPSP